MIYLIHQYVFILSDICQYLTQGPEKEYLGKLPVRFRKLANRQQKQLAKTPRQVRPWPWINDREV